MDSFALVIFGITSNLAQIKLIPALYDMEEKGILPENMGIVGIARKEMDDEGVKRYLHSVLHLENIHHQHEIKEDVFERLIKRFKYISGQITERNLYQKLKQYLRHENRIFYLATYPDLYQDVFENLKKNNLNKQSKGWVRLMVEKPIGTDLPSAKALDKLLLSYFNENQIYRLDHYLGKETMQNILTFRFANSIFEDIIDRHHIDHIQITASENFGVGKRGGYYDQVGALKDVGQNHQLQMLAFATMEAPKEFSNEAVTRERLKIVKSLKPLPEKIVFGQYEGYTEEESVDHRSKTDTFYAFKAYIDNERFKGVPIYVRAGKKMKQTTTEIAIFFKKPANKLFNDEELGDEPNILIYRIQPNEGIVFRVLTKAPGYQMKLKHEHLQYCYRIDTRTHLIPDPYERLIMDVTKGDQTFFNDSAEVEAQWAFIDPLIAVKGTPHKYKQGSWGPEESDKLIEADGRKWLEPSADFCKL